MHARSILITLIIYLGVGPWQGHAETSSASSFFDRVLILNSALTKEKEFGQRHQLFIRARVELQELRKKSPRKDETEELAQSLYLNALSGVPKVAKGFSASQCKKALEESRHNFAVHEKGETPELALQRAWQTLENLCEPSAQGAKSKAK